jgi:hypothetical protein
MDGSGYGHYRRAMTGVYPATPGPGRAARSRRSVGPWVYVVAVLVVVGMLAVVFVFARSAASPARRAITACEDAVKDHVDEPSTAKFTAETATDNGDGTWDVFGSIAARGGSGTTETHSFTCAETEQGGDFEVTDASVF